MKSAEFHEKLKDSGIKTFDVLEKLLKDERFKKEENRNKYPDIFDSNGNIKMKFEPNKKMVLTYCPFHEDQKNGNSFAVYNNDQSAYCYNKCTPKPLNIVEMVICLQYDVKPEVAVSELGGEHFWKAARYLVKNFGKELGLTLDDIKAEGTFKRDITQEILQVSAEYYHFLATKTNYAKKLDEYYLNKRHFKHAEVPFEKIKSENMLGITPRSDDGDKLYQYLKKKKFSDAEILESRVCFQTETGKIMDSFRNHAIVPYFYKKKVFGFYGKNFNKEAKTPHKRLAGIYDTPAGLDDIMNYEWFMVGEGENTKLAVKAMGFENVMETRGARGFKDGHAEKIKKMRELDPTKMKVVFLILDPDSTGREATMEIGRQLMDIAGCEVLCVEMPILEKDGEPWYLDVNDLFEAYGDKAKEIFISLKEKAKSLDAFCLVNLLRKEEITTLSEARMAIKRHSGYLNAIEKTERVFIMEEVLEILSPSFNSSKANDVVDLSKKLINQVEKTIGTLSPSSDSIDLSKGILSQLESMVSLLTPTSETVELNKDLLRQYLKESWLEQEVKRPIEGLEEAVKLKHTYWIITKDEETYKKYKEKAPHLLLVRDLNKLKEKISGKNLLFDSSFEYETVAQFSSKESKVFTGDLVEDGEDKKVAIDNLKKII